MLVPDSDRPDGQLYAVRRSFNPTVPLEKPRKLGEGPTLSEMDTELETFDFQLSTAREVAAEYKALVAKCKAVIKASKAALPKTRGDANREQIEKRLADAERWLDFNKKRLAGRESFIQGVEKNRACYIAQWAERRKELEEAERLESELKAAYQGSE